MKKKYFIKYVFIVAGFFSLQSLSAQIEIPVVAHIVRKSDGTSPRVSSIQVDDVITQLNNAYNYLNITFTKCNENFVDNDFMWDQFDSGDDANKLLLDNYTIKNVANIFFTDLISGSHGRAVFPYKQKDWVIVDYNYIGSNHTTIIHEFGHYFGLHHTYSGVDDDNPTSSSSLTIDDAEGPEGWKYGDFLIDTPLDPENRDDYDNNCNYIGNQVDANEDTFHPDGTNYMGKGHGFCRSSFTLGQEKRMLEYIKRYRYYLECNATSKNNNLACSNSASVATFPHNDNFERDDTNDIIYWVQARDGDDLNWRNGPETSSSSTGPSSAQNGQTFMYLEASLKYTSSDKTVLLSPCYNFTGKNYANIEFYYHMHGSNTGSLELEISVDNGINWISIFNIDEEQHDFETSPWTKQVITLDDYIGNNAQLRFTARSIGSSKSDISIDNITVNASEMPLSVHNNTFATLKLYPNPVTDILKIDSPTLIVKTVEIYTIMGSTIYKSKVSYNKKEINVSPLSKGVYLIKIIAENGNESVVKFIKS